MSSHDAVKSKIDEMICGFIMEPRYMLIFSTCGTCLVIMPSSGYYVASGCIGSHSCALFADEGAASADNEGASV